MKFIIVFMSGFFIAADAYACTLTRKLLDNEDPTINCPKDVAQLIERMVLCTHWAGEEPYDTARQKQIEQALEASGCETLACEGKKLFDIYASSKQIQAALIGAWKTLNQEDLKNTCPTQ